MWIFRAEEFSHRLIAMLITLLKLVSANGNAAFYPIYLPAHMIIIFLMAPRTRYGTACPLNPDFLFRNTTVFSKFPSTIWSNRLRPCPSSPVLHFLSILNLLKFDEIRVKIIGLVIGQKQMENLRLLKTFYGLLLKQMTKSGIHGPKVDRTRTRKILKSRTPSAWFPTDGPWIPG